MSRVDEAKRVSTRRVSGSRVSVRASRSKSRPAKAVLDFLMKACVYGATLSVWFALTAVAIHTFLFCLSGF